MGRIGDVGINAYRSLIICVDTAIEEGHSEMAIVCASGLVSLADAEGANYLPSEARFNYNIAIKKVKQALGFAKSEGLPSFQRRTVIDIENKLKNMGYSLD